LTQLLEVQGGEVDLAQLTPSQRTRLAGLLEQLQDKNRKRQLYSMFPTGGDNRRELYPKHLEFFEHGAAVRERVFMAANRVGKTVSAGCELAYHMTGNYPAWWVGHRFDRPIRAMVSGDTHETTRDILQLKLVGATTDRKEDIGTGLIPGEAITGFVARNHVKGAIEKVMVRHVSGRDSELWLRSYEQGREIFQGFELDLFWADEECPEDVYDEALVRLMTRKGISMLTFTPLSGLTPLVLRLMKAREMGQAGIAITQCGWDDVPHLDPQIKAEMIAKLPPHQRDARTKGIPALGSGAIYPIAESEFVVDDFQLPAHWARSYGMDVGWNRTAAVFGAWDRDTDTLYIYSEHYRGLAEPSIHAAAIQARGDWMQGAIDPASRGRGQRDGEQLLSLYQELGLQLVLANNGVEAGIYEVWQRLSTGRLKVFKSCANLLAEYRLYRRDDKGRVVKENDHALDALRYLVMSGKDIAGYAPAAAKKSRTSNWRVV
jgi:phage terminase large subunit-like protein